MHAAAQGDVISLQRLIAAGADMEKTANPMLVLPACNHLLGFFLMSI
jgi:hypothetical protein